eukprot:12251743-Prorocentrum_lima.AAC.1
MIERETTHHTNRWDTDDVYRKRRAAYGATRKNNNTFATMPWVPESPEAQPVPVRPDFVIRCKVLVLKLIAHYKILKAALIEEDPLH